MEGVRQKRTTPAQDQTEDKYRRADRASQNERQRRVERPNTSRKPSTTSANRVGALVALDRGLIRGGSRDDALLLGRAAGLTSLGPLVERLLDERR